MRHDRAAFLAQAGLVEPAHEPSVEQGGRAEDLVDGDDAGAADSRHDDMAVARDARFGLGQLGIDGHATPPC